MATLGEGIESIGLACSLVLLIPAVGVALLGPRRRIIVPVWIVTVTLVAWLRFAGWWNLESSGIWHALSGVALVALAVGAWKLDRLASDVAVAVGAATIAAWTWVPCVGRRLGNILNSARAEPWSQLVPTGLFVLGLFVPLVLLAALEVAFPAVGEWIDRLVIRRVGLMLVVLVGVLVSATLFDDLAGELARRSSF